MILGQSIAEIALQQQVAALQAQVAALTSTGAIQVVSPVSADGTRITLVRGDDYTGARAIALTIDAGLDLTTTINVCTITSRQTGLSINPTVTATSATTVTISIAPGRSAALNLGTDAYFGDIQATVADRPITIARFEVTVLADATL